MSISWEIEYFPPLIVTLAVLSLLILAGNVFTIVVIRRTQHLQNATGYFMINLAMSDIGVGATIAAPLLYATITNEMTPIACDVFGFLQSVCWLESIFTLLLLSVDRYLIIAHPFSYTTLVTTRRVVLAIGLSWLLAAGMWAFPLADIGAYSFNDEELACYFDVVRYPMQWIVYMGVIFVPALAVLAFTYARVGIIAAHAHRAIAAAPVNPEDNSQSASRSRHLKAFRTIVIIVGAFFVAWLPFVIEHIVKAVYGQLQIVPEWLEITIYVLALANSGWNPFIYMGTVRPFRQAAIATIKSCQVPPANGGRQIQSIQHQEGQSQLKVEQSHLEDGQSQLEAGSIQLQEGQSQLEAGQSQLEAGKSQLEAGNSQLEAD